MGRIGGGGWLPAMAGLVLAAGAWPTLAPVIAQEPASEEALIERLRQIQGQPTPGAATPQRRDAQAGAATGEGPALGEDEVQTLVREGLGVEVLGIEAVESEGRPAYAVTVMSPPGNDNSALAVETLLVDGATGGLLGRVPQTPRVAGPDPAESAGSGAPEPSGLEIRRRTYR
jgi:hypothetical protein